MKEYKKFFKVFWAFQDDSEEKWLQKMSKQGYHFVKCTWGLYTFEKGEAQNYTYILDYKTTDNNDLPHYLEIYKESGLEYLDHFNRWYYFRGNQNPDTEKLSKGNLSKRLANYKFFSSMIMFTALLNIVVSLNHMFNPPILNHHVTFLSRGYLNLICALGLGAIYMAFMRKIKKLKQDSSYLIPVESLSAKILLVVNMVLIMMCVGIAIIHSR